MLSSIVAIVSGVLGASSFIIKKNPDSADLIKKIKPYEAFIGVAALFIGVTLLLSYGRLSGLGLLATLAESASCIVLGFLLGFPVLQDLFIDDMSEDSRNKADQLYERLTPYKVTAGLVAIGSGICAIIF